VRFSERLRSLGFSEDASAGAPPCRWRQGPAVLDVMPLEPGILGFSNRWYRDAMNTAIIFALEPELEARVISAPLFLATKLEAFKGRGRGDYIASHDLEDVIAVIDGRIELMDEVSSSVKSVRAYLSAELRGLLKQGRFLDALPAHLPPDSASQSRLPLLLKRIRRLAE